MATSRSLGTLTLDIIAKIGGFESGMDKAARTADNKARQISASQRREAKASAEAWSRVAGVVGSLFAGISVGLVFTKFITETRNAEQEQAQLAAALKSTGESAGFTQSQLNSMADAMEKRSIFSAGEITEAQTRMMSYMNVVGEEFPMAMQATIDMATRMGMDVKQAAETVGKALDIPSQGMATLTRQGFKFTDDQKKLAEQLEATGRIAEAQGIIFAELNPIYSGAAAAARDTFGGSMTALQNNINSLLTGDSGSMAQMKESVESLNTLLADEKTKAAFQSLTGSLSTLALGLAAATTELVSFGIEAGNFLADLRFGKVETNDPISDYTNKINTLGMAASKLQLSLSYWNFDFIKEGQRKELAGVLAQLDAFEKLRANLVEKNAADSGEPDPKTPRPVIDAAGAAARIKAEEDARKKREADRIAAEKAAEAYILQLREQVGKVNELTAVEKVLYDLQLDKVNLSHQQKNTAFMLAQEIDDTKKLVEEKKADLELTTARITAQREFNLTMDQYARQLDGMGLGNVAREKMAGVSQINDKYAGDLRRIEDGKREAIYDGKWTVQAEARYAEEIAMIKAFNTQALGVHDEYWVKRKAQEGDWALGANEAMVNYANESANVFAQTQDLFSSAFKGMEDSLVSFVTTGKGNFSDLAQSIISDLIRIQIRSAMTTVIGGAGGLLSTIAGTLAGGAVAGGASSSMYSLGGSGSSISGFRADGGPVSAGGLYRVNERGPEMLDVGGKQYLMMGNQSGSVGANGGGALGGSVNVSVSVDAGSSTVQGNGDQSAQLGAMIGNAVRGVLLKEKRPGGMLA